MHTSPSYIKDLLPWILLAVLTGSWLLNLDIQQEESNSNTTLRAASYHQVEPTHLAHLARQLEATSLQVATYSVPPFAETDLQTAELDQVFYVIQGRATLTMDNKSHLVQPGSVIFVKAQVPHQFVDIEDTLKVLIVSSTSQTDA